MKATDSPAKEASASHDTAGFALGWEYAYPALGNLPTIVESSAAELEVVPPIIDVCCSEATALPSILEASGVEAPATPPIAIACSTEPSDQYNPPYPISPRAT